MGAGVVASNGILGLMVSSMGSNSTNLANKEI